MHVALTPAFGVLVVCVLSSFTIAAQDKGDISLRMEYQYIRTGEFVSNGEDLDIGHTDAHAYYLSLDYALDDRWTVTASLPWIKKRHTGALPHNPVLDFVNYQPPDLNIVDDGNYHNNWQDLYLGAHYLIERNNLTVRPHIAYGWPTNDYQVYAHAAVGRNRWHIPVGVTMTYVPWFSNFSYDADITYVFTQKTLGEDISHWLVSASIGYYLGPTVLAKIFATAKHSSKGLEWPDDADLVAWDTEHFYYHDRLFTHNYVNAGVSLDWGITENYEMGLSWFKMVDPDNVNDVERAWSFSLTRHISQH